MMIIPPNPSVSYANTPSDEMVVSHTACLIRWLYSRALDETFDSVWASSSISAMCSSSTASIALAGTR